MGHNWKRHNVQVCMTFDVRRLHRVRSAGESHRACLRSVIVHPAAVEAQLNPELSQSEITDLILVVDKDKNYKAGIYSA